MEKECKIHGLTEHVLRNNGQRLRCKKCCSEAVTKRRKKLKTMSIEYKGCKCERCGYDKCVDALEFHHLDPNEKEFAISGKKQTSSWEKIKAELDKCIMVCANCHREIHSELRTTSSIGPERTPLKR